MLGIGCWKLDVGCWMLDIGLRVKFLTVSFISVLPFLLFAYC